MIDTEALRKKVIDLAIQGKLTEQLSSDGDAETLYAKIQEEKAKLVKEGKIKKEKPLPEITEDEIPFEIPESWKWVRLASIYEINPKVEANGNDIAAFIAMENISPGFSRIFSYEEQNWREASKNHTKFQDGDVAFAKISPCFENRKSFIAKGLPNGIGGGTTELIILRQKFVLSEYTYFIVTSQRFIDAGSMSYKGIVGQQRIKSDIVNSFLVPLPPLVVQKRIADKIDEVIKYIEIIDDLQAKYRNDLSVLKSKIIDAGIQGKLTEQLPEDGTAEELLKNIQFSREKAFKSGHIKKDTVIKSISSEDIPCDIPLTWEWTRLGSVATILGGKRIPAGRKLTTEDTGHKYIRVSEMKDHSIITEGLLYVPKDIYPSISQYIINKEDVYITVAGTIGRVGKIPAKIDGANLTENADRIVFSDLDQDWLIFCLSSSVVQKQIEMLTTQVAQPKLAIKKIQEFLIPLPPFAEQTRIAKRISDVLALIS